LPSFTRIASCDRPCDSQPASNTEFLTPPHSQEIAAAKAGISVRSARRIERDTTLPSQKSRGYWHSRPDPFADVWDTEVVPMLTNAPQLQAITILRKLQDDHPGSIRTAPVARSSGV
jgi:hypothetical protein